MSTDGVETAGRRLLAVTDQQTWVDLGQVAVADKTNEITAFTPLDRSGRPSSRSPARSPTG